MILVGRGRTCDVRHSSRVVTATADSARVAAATRTRGHQYWARGSSSGIRARTSDPFERRGRRSQGGQAPPPASHSRRRRDAGENGLYDVVPEYRGHYDPAAVTARWGASQPKASGAKTLLARRETGRPKLNARAGSDFLHNSKQAPVRPRETRRVERSQMRMLEDPDAVAQRNRRGPQGLQHPGSGIGRLGRSSAAIGRGRSGNAKGARGKRSALAGRHDDREPSECAEGEGRISCAVDAGREGDEAITLGRRRAPSDVRFFVLSWINRFTFVSRATSWQLPGAWR